MSQATIHQPGRSAVLAEAFVNAGRFLGLSQAELGAVIGKDRTAVSRGRLDPDSKAGELALLFIRCYRALYALTGGEAEQNQQTRGKDLVAHGLRHQLIHGFHLADGHLRRHLMKGGGQPGAELSE